MAAIAVAVLCSVAAARAEEPTAPQRAWVMAASALLTERNGGRHDLLASVELTPGNIAGVKQLLKDWWGVTDRPGLLAAIRGVEESGHRVPFARLGARLAAMTPAERRAIEVRRRQDFKLNQTLGVVELHFARLGGKGLLGWDLARVVSLCRWGVAAGFFSEKDAWDRMMPAARLLRSTFGSWRELGENYLIGRQFWDPEEHVQTGHLYRQTFDRLLADPGSPWNRVPWNVDFGPPPPAVSR